MEGQNSEKGPPPNRKLWKWVVCMHAFPALSAMKQV
jgi:hypothetical protein